MTSLPTSHALHLLDHTDTVAVAVRDLAAGETIETTPGHTLTVLDDVPRGHKVALADVAVGRQVRKYAHVIGRATQDIRAGEHVHSHNLAFSDHVLDESADSAVGATRARSSTPTASPRGR
ncbi:UxaA family hydrolase [Raineyella fluvialis]|uniref:UxaA family hydrolase n=1 Tax=Raineyella fluvialis TaxID=2662261 RepID=UPI001E586FD1|nr:UxaA family hydrolase [Raineyella fluvialis]